MAWFTRFTRFGDIHFVYGQEKDMNCGPACVLMCVLKVNKATPHQAVAVEDQVRKMYNQATGERDSGDLHGTGPGGLVSVLNNLNCGRWKCDHYAPAAASQKIVDVVGTSSALSGAIVNVSPVIVAMDWDAGGAHWVVIDTVRTLMGSSYATVCDPWDANVHVQGFDAKRPFVYHARAESRIDFWGSHKEHPGGESGQIQIGPGAKTTVGRLGIWPVIYRA